jgi:CheY-like chemotaxis protein
MTADAPSGGTLLVIEDNELAREGMADVLTRRGYTVVTAADGAEALARLRGGLRPALILLDMLTPYVDGWHFLSERRRDPTLATIPVLITTGLIVAGPEWAASLGATGFLRKPIDDEALIREVGRCCGQASTAS